MVDSHSPVFSDCTLHGEVDHLNTVVERWGLLGFLMTLQENQSILDCNVQSWHRTCYLPHLHTNGISLCVCFVLSPLLGWQVHKGTCRGSVIVYLNCHS